MPDVIRAPWTDDEVKRLNAFQTSGVFHPFTCGKPHNVHVDLVATNDGWRCPSGCGYEQDWAIDSMLDTELVEKQREYYRSLGLTL